MDKVPLTVDDVFVLKHAASFYFRTKDMAQMKIHAQLVLDETLKLLDRFSQDELEGGYMMLQYFEIRKLYELKREVDIMIEQLLMSNSKDNADQTEWKVYLEETHKSLRNARGPGSNSKSSVAAKN